MSRFNPGSSDIPSTLNLNCGKCTEIDESPLQKRWPGPFRARKLELGSGVAYLVGQPELRNDVVHSLRAKEVEVRLPALHASPHPSVFPRQPLSIPHENFPPSLPLSPLPLSGSTCLCALGPQAVAEKYRARIPPKTSSKESPILPRPLSPRQKSLFPRGRGWTPPPLGTSAKAPSNTPLVLECFGPGEVGPGASDRGEWNASCQGLGRIFSLWTLGVTSIEGCLWICGILGGKLHLSTAGRQ